MAIHRVSLILLGGASLVLVTVAVIGGSFTGVTAARADEIRGGVAELGSGSEQAGVRQRSFAIAIAIAGSRLDQKSGAGAEGSGTTRAATELERALART